MAYRTIYTCDKCQKEETKTSGQPLGWYTVELKMGEYNRKNFLLCDECLIKYGLMTKKANDKEEPTPVSTTHEILFEIIETMVAEALERMR